MNIRPIKNQKDYQAALKRVELLWDAPLNTDVGDELDILVTLIEKYEEKELAILPPDPVEAIKFRLQQMNLDAKDLAEIIGANRASEILNQKRGLSIGIIRTLCVELNIPADSLIGV